MIHPTTSLYAAIAQLCTSRIASERCIHILNKHTCVSLSVLVTNYLCTKINVFLLLSLFC